MTRNWRITFRINTTEGEIEVSRYIVKNPKTRPGGVQPPSPPIKAFSR